MIISIVNPFQVVIRWYLTRPRLLCTFMMEAAMSVGHPLGHCSALPVFKAGSLRPREPPTFVFTPPCPSSHPTPQKGQREGDVRERLSLKDEWTTRSRAHCPDLQEPVLRDFIC